MTENIEFVEGYSSVGKALKQEREWLGPTPDLKWSETQSSIDTYQDLFSLVLDGKPIKELLRGKREPVVIDLMSSTGAIATLFERLKQKNKLGVAVSLEDRRLDEYKAEDDKLGIVQEVGNVVDSSTWRAVEARLQGRKADLILERAVGGISSLPYSRLVYCTLLQRAWDLLAVDGVMLLQPPFNKQTGEPLPLNGLVGYLTSLGIEARTDRFNNALYVRKVATDPADLFPAQPDSPAVDANHKTADDIDTVQTIV